MLPNIKKILAVLFILCLIISCTSFEEGNEQNREATDSTYYNTYNKPLLELTQEQQSAFDALNKLQVSTDEMNRLYSTFANVYQTCYPGDTTFEISQSELRLVMQQFITKHCKRLTPEIQNQLAKSSVLAQEKYTVLHCTGNESDVVNEKGFPMTGTWLMPNVLGRRDVILVW